MRLSLRTLAIASALATGLAPSSASADHGSQTLPLGLQGRVLIAEDFFEPDRLWPAGSDAIQAWDYADGEFRARILAEGGYSSSFVHRLLVDDIGLEVDARAAQAGSSTAYGLLFASSHPDHSPFVRTFFRVDPDGGRFDLVRWVDTVFTRLEPWQASDAILRGGATNHLRVDRVGDEVRLSINHQRVKTLQMPHAESDAVGLGISDLSREASADARFDNFLLEELETGFPTPTPSGTWSSPTPLPTPTPRPTPLPRPTSDDPDLLYYDDFEDPSSGWPVYNLVDSSAVYENGEYRIQVRGTGEAPFSPFAGPDPGDYELRVTVRYAGPPEALFYGLVFGADRATGITFRVDPAAGRFGLFEETFGVGERAIVDWTESDAIRRIDAVNELAILRQGDRVGMLINDRLVGVTRLSRSVVVPGLLAGGVCPNFCSVYFDDFTIRRPRRLLPTQSPPTASPQPRATLTPIPQGWRRPRIFLPLTALNLQPWQILPPLPWREPVVELDFAAAVDESGALIDPADRFPHGIELLYGRIRYRDLQPGEHLRWSWWIDGRPQRMPGLWGELRTEASQGSLLRSIARGEGGPLPAGEYALVVELPDRGRPPDRGTAIVDPLPWQHRNGTPLSIQARRGPGR